MRLLLVLVALRGTAWGLGGAITETPGPATSAAAAVACTGSSLNIDGNTLYVDCSNNRVGVGNASPTAPLQVSGRMDVPMIVEISTLAAPPAGSLEVYTGGGNRAFYCNSTQNCLIGLTTSSSIRGDLDIVDDQSAADLFLRNTDNGINPGEIFGTLHFRSEDTSTGGAQTKAHIQAISLDAYASGDQRHGAVLAFGISDTGGQDATNYMLLTSTGLRGNDPAVLSFSTIAARNLFTVGSGTFTVTPDGWMVASGTMSVTQLSGCGTGATFLPGSGHNAGKINTVITGAMSCVFTFKTGAPNGRAPACNVTNETTANLIRATSTSTNVTFAGTAVSGDVISYTCLGM